MEKSNTTTLAPPDEEAAITPPKRQPNYAVIIENDDYHTFAYVIIMLQQIFGHPIEKATQLTKKVHNDGEAVVWDGTLELAELKRDQVKGFGADTFAAKTVTFPIGVRIEPLQ